MIVDIVAEWWKLTNDNVSEREDNRNRWREYKTKMIITAGEISTFVG